MSKLSRFTRQHWLHAIQATAWLALCIYYANALIESGWIPARDADFGWWYVKGVFVVLVAAITVYGITELLRIVVEAWRKA